MDKLTSNAIKTKKILMWNAYGLKNKMIELQELTKRERPGIILISETLIPKGNYTPQIPQYITIMQPKLNKRRGTAIFIHKSINYTHEDIKTSNTECLAIRTSTITIVNTYKSPTETFNNQDLDKIFANDRVVAAGDYNAHNTIWNSNYTNDTGRKLWEYTEENGIDLHTPTEYTRIPFNVAHNPSTIDIILSKNIPITNIQVLHELSSDHNPVTFEISSPISTNPIVPRTMKDYAKADWISFRHEINRKLQINRSLNSKEDIEQQYCKIVKIIKEAANNNIPDAPPPQQNKQSPEIQALIQQRNRLRRQFQRNRNTNMANDLADLNTIIRTRLWAECEEKWHRRVRKTQNNKDNIWKLIKGRKRRQNDLHIPTLKTNNMEHTTDKEKAETLADIYSRMGSISENLVDQQTEQLVENFIQRLHATYAEVSDADLTSPKEIAQIIKTMKANKAPGWDGIQGILLKNIPKKMLVQLYYIYKACMKQQTFPRPWKQAIILPIKKPKKSQQDPYSYRPIALLPTIGKVYEKIILKRMNQHLQGRIIDEQFGFQAGKSTTMQLARIIDKIMINFNINRVSNLTILDLEKAYDTVWHNALLMKASQTGLPPYLVKIIKSFLEDRTIKVSCNNTLSHSKPVTTGVPQGSIISPTLFNIYINDIPQDQNTNLALYADDTAIMTHSHNENQARIYTQRHLNVITQYFRKWKLKVNEDKTQTITLTKKTKQPTETNKIKINGIEIDETTEVKYLGVTLDKRLTFRKHIRETRKKAAAARQLILPYINFHTPMPKKLKLQIYKTYVASILTYASPVWSSASTTNRRYLQVAETTCLRKIIGKTASEITNQELYRETNIKPLPIVIKERTQKFFGTVVKRHEFTNKIGSTTTANAPFLVKHKLINSLIDT